MYKTKSPKNPSGKRKALPRFEEVVLFIRARNYLLKPPWEFEAGFWDLIGGGFLFL